MTDVTVLNAIDYYARNGAALFPIPTGQKNPTGIVASWRKDYSKDPAQWSAWQAANPGCNFGVVAFASNWIIVDIDVSESREAAWAAWCELCTAWGIAPATPHVQSARGGWHVYFQVPEGIDAATLRQPDAIKKRINIRCGGFTVAAGSTFDNKPYVLLTDVAPHPAPAALIEHCTRRAAPAASGNLGTRDRGDVASLLTWLNERQAFAAYEDWCAAGMALKLEYGDSGLELWRLTHDPTVDTDTETTKWHSFSTEANAQSVTLNSFLDRAHKMGWRGSVRKSTSALFDGVAAIAAAAGANLPGVQPMPMMAGQQVLSDLGTPILNEFLAATAQDAPARPTATDLPTLPVSLSEHGLYDLLGQSVSRIFALAEQKGWKAHRVTDALAVLSLVHSDVFESVRRRLNASGLATADSKIKLAATNLAERVERAFVKQDDWQYDPKTGQIEHNNSDNVAVFLGIVKCELRFNAWLERMEIRGGTPGDDLYWAEWSFVDDGIVAKLRTRANRTKTRFLPGEKFFWESLFAIAAANSFDPARQMLDTLESSWDGTPRLMTWLSTACGVPCDPYHQAVGRNIIGGMVRRIREPGCKHDTMLVLYGYQGSGKSTLANILSVNPEWFTDEVMLGDASKELVLSLAGKSIVEIGEMGMRGSANPNHVKAMLSRQVDRGRTAYARTVTDRRRRNIFIGTTNDTHPLVDPTGNRRFLPVKIEREVDVAWLRENIGQLVGEAAHLHSAGATFAIPREVWTIAAEHQEAARSVSDVETMLHEWFAPGPYAGEVNYVLAADLVRLASLAGWKNGGATAVRGAIMKQMGFANELVMYGGRRTRMWIRRPAHVRPADVIKIGVRYVVSIGSDGFPRVEIRAGNT